MPRGFLVKRTQKRGSGSRLRAAADEEDRNETGSGSELDSPLLIHTSAYLYPYGSPDSGFSQSPVNLTTKSVRNADPDVQSDSQSTSGKETIASDVSSGSDLDDAHVQVKADAIVPDRTSPRATSEGESDCHPGNSRPSYYGIPQRLPPNPPSISTSILSSPQFYYTAFDRLSVASPKGYGFPGNAPPYLSGAGLFPGFPPMAAAGRLIPNSPAGRGNAISPNKRKSPERHGTGAGAKTRSAKKSKAVRKIQFDEDKSSPVSGTIIRDPSDVDDDGGIRVVSGDIDASLNFVEVTPEARQELAKIENRIGAYICQLCKEHYEDAFQLAQHRCSRIIHVEYRCPECDKVFNCPANLASHRRWHKPRPSGAGNNNNNNNNNNSNTNNNNNNDSNNSNNNNNSSQNDNDNGGKDKSTAVPRGAGTERTLNAINGNLANRNLTSAMFLDDVTKLVGRGVENVLRTDDRKTPSPDSESAFECEKCGKRFRRLAYLRKHVASHVAAAAADDVMMTSSHPRPIGGKAFESSRAEQHVLALRGESYDRKCSSPASTAASPHHQHHHHPHHGADPYGCALCGQSLGSQLELEGHQRLRHPNEIYACKYCTAVFYSSPGLTRHTNKYHPTDGRQAVLLQLQPPAISPMNSPC